MSARRAVSALAAATVAVVPAAPASAVPPLVVSGVGYISPGLTVPDTIYPVSISFTGTGTLGAVSYACSLHGSGTNVPMGGASGFLEGSCGPIVYTGCAFTLSPTTWQIGCTTSAGTFSVSYLDLNPTTRFTATGVMA